MDTKRNFSAAESSVARRNAASSASSASSASTATTLSTRCSCAGEVAEMEKQSEANAAEAIADATLHRKGPQVVAQITSRCGQRRLPCRRPDARSRDGARHALARARPGRQLFRDAMTRAGCRRSASKEPRWKRASCAIALAKHSR
jgi:hypothetical protein